MKGEKKTILEDKFSEEFKMIEDLLAPHLTERLSKIFKTTKGRKKFLSTICHNNIFNLKFRKLIQKSQDGTEDVCKALLIKKAPNTCYVISTGSSLDGQSMLLEDSIYKVQLELGSVVCCIPGKLLYFTNEDREKYIIEKE